MRKTLIIIGASGHGKVCLDIAQKMKLWDQIYFLDNDENLSECLGYPVIGVTSDAEKYKEEADFFVAIGNNKIREKVQLKLKKENYKITTLIHPDATINSFVEIDTGTVIMAGVVINSDTKVGKGCILNTNSTIEHDNKIGDYVHISPGVNIAGTVKIGDRTWIGIGSNVINNLTIHSDVTIGAGSLIINNVDKEGVFYGTPLKL